MPQAIGLQPEEAKAIQGRLKFLLETENDDVVSKALDFTEQLVRADSGPDYEKQVIVDDLVKATGCKLQTAGAVLAALQIVLRIIIGVPDLRESADLFNGLANDKVDLSAAEKERLIPIVDPLMARVDYLRHLDRTTRLVRGYSPMFSDLSASVELRSTLSPFSLRESGGAPEPFELEPIASLRLQFDVGFPKEVHFQVTHDQINAILIHLARVKEAMAKLKSQVSINLEK